MPTATLPRTVVNRILAHAQQAPQTEVCGLIGGRAGRPATVYPVANVAGEPERLFEMDPKGQIDAMRAMREAGEELFAIYHSHPHAPAAPSPRDIDQAAYPGVLYLIVSLDIGGVLQMRGYRLRSGDVTTVELELA